MEDEWPVGFGYSLNERVHFTSTVGEMRTSWCWWEAGAGQQGTT